MYKFTWYLMIMFGLVLSACAPVVTKAESDPSFQTINVTTTTGMITDLVKNIGGERVTVTGLMGAGVDPHLYKASERDVIALQEADMIFYNGLHLEAGMATVLEKLAERRPVVAVSDSIDRSELLAPPEFQGAYDPHIWFDVQMWMKAAEKVQASLSEFDPQYKDVYQANMEQYLAELQELDAYVRSQAARLPEDQRVLVTAHDAFNYFGRAYGFEVKGLQGISTQSEASTADVQALAEFIASRKIPAIFVESSVPQRNIEAVQASVQAKGWQVVIGGSLYSDAMGDAGTIEGTYTGMIRRNIDTIVSALLGQ